MRFWFPVWLLLASVLFGQADLNGNLTSTIDARGNEVRTSYDALNRPTETLHYDSTGALLGSSSVAYDAAGRRSATVDEEGKRSEFRYDGAGRLTEVWALIEGTLVLQARYTYDERGRQLTQEDALGRVTRYEYDAMGRRSARILPEGQRESYAYDTQGRLAERQDFKGNATTYSYDALTDALLAETPGGTYSSQVGVAYTYDAMGRRTRMTDASGTTTYTYDAQGRTATVTQFVGTVAETTLSYSYDATSNLLGIQSSSSDGVDLSYAYDELGRLATAANGVYQPPMVTTYRYNAVGSLESVSHNNGQSADYSYDGRNRLSNLVVSNSILGQTLGSFSYTRDRVGNATRIVEQLRSASGSSLNRTVNYAYDDLHRLTSEVLGGDEETGTVGYTFDAVSNRIGRTSTVAGITPQSLSYSANDWLNGHTYDSNGNTLRSILNFPDGLEPVAVDEYDYRNRLSQRRIYDPSGTLLRKVIDLRYDGDGALKWKRVTDAVSGEVTTRYYIVDHLNLTGYSQILEELDETGAVVASYHYGLDLIGQSRLVVDSASGSSEWQDRIFLYDGGGSVRALTDLEGYVTDTFSYDAFGNLLSDPSAVASAKEDLPTSYLYRGERYDADLGQYYLRARFYDANLGRFHTLDDYEGRTGEPLSLHKYLYAHANPVTGWDPSGRFSLGELSISMGISSIISASFGYFGGQRSIGAIGENLVVGALEGAAFYGAGSLAIKVLARFAAFIQTARVSTKAARAIGNVWSKVKPVGSILPGCVKLPSQFVLETPVGKYFISSATAGGRVTGALKHIIDEIFPKIASKSGGSVGELAESLMIQELEAVIVAAEVQGIKDMTKMSVKTAFAEWELMFQTNVAPGMHPKLFHAIAKGYSL
jgi:RHS repeat-associated protein